MAYVVEHFIKSKDKQRRARCHARARERTSMVKKYAREARVGNKNMRVGLATDLPEFMLHANRKSVNVDDVLLVVRKNPDLKRKLNDFVR